MGWRGSYRTAYRTLRPLMSNAREDRHIVRSAQQNHTATLWTLSQEMEHRDCDSGAPNYKTGYRNGTISSFQKSPCSACRTLMAVFVIGGSDETVFCLLQCFSKNTMNMKRKENFQWLPKELHQLKYEAISVPQGSVRLVKRHKKEKVQLVIC
ncbi:hypothetical protein TNCV_4202571 [Trichonephila clavipes]|uniref:Uncharacterized protein n=1 Tax=Trichonephila clavipes TaxID=2585209 RepID=A0A8X6S5Q9_TRICX|nr:hypothetical protein TNCV_4202571 [Trichonephila clavipes]